LQKGNSKKHIWISDGLSKKIWWGRKQNNQIFDVQNTFSELLADLQRLIIINYEIIIKNQFNHHLNNNINQNILTATLFMNLYPLIKKSDLN